MNQLTRVSTTGKPWIDCPRCNGTGIKTYMTKTGTEGSGPCFRCSGTGDGNIVTAFRGRSRRGSGNGQSWPGGTIIPRDNGAALPDDDDDDDDMHDDDTAPLPVPPMPMPMPLPDDADDDDVAAAARKLAEAIAARRAKAPPLDESAVRRIAEDVVAKATTIPRRLDIIVNGSFTGTLPAIRHHATEELIDCLASGEHVALVGPAGSGKTKGAEVAFEALGRKFRIQSAIGDMTELVGFVDGYGNYHTTPTRESVQHGGGLVCDEFDGSIDPATPLKLNAILQNGYGHFPDSPDPIVVHEDFLCIVTGNTWHGPNGRYMGRTQLDQATLDRFHFIAWDYDPALESALCPNAEWLSFVQSARAAVDRLGIEIVISTRAAIRGARQLARGMARESVERGNIWRALPKDDVARIQAAMREV